MLIDTTRLCEKKTHLSITDFETALIDVMIQNDLTPPPRFTYDKFVNFRSKEHGCKRKCCAYIANFKFKSAYLKCWRRKIEIKWRYGNKTYGALSTYEKKQIKKLLIENKKKEEIEFQRKRKIDIELLHLSKPAIAHLYIKQKRIIPYGAYELEDSLYIPLFDIKSKFMCCQEITKNFYGNGFFKKFTNRSKGGMHVIGTLDSSTEHVLICEGWATGCTIYKATQMTTICAFTCHNIVNVVEAVKRNYPRSKIIICADNDLYGEKNIGTDTAYDLSKKYNIDYIYPDFTSLPLTTKPTDFNDLFLLSDLNYVRQQISNQISNH